jgi:hypothetical protein
MAVGDDAERRISTIAPNLASSPLVARIRPDRADYGRFYRAAGFGGGVDLTMIDLRDISVLLCLLGGFCQCLSVESN